MTKVTYEVTSKGLTVTVKTLADAQAIIRKGGGHYKAKYTPIFEKPIINPNRKRVCLRQLAPPGQRNLPIFFEKFLKKVLDKWAEM